MEGGALITKDINVTNEEKKLAVVIHISRLQNLKEVKIINRFIKNCSLPPTYRFSEIVHMNNTRVKRF